MVDCLTRHRLKAGLHTFQNENCRVLASASDAFYVAPIANLPLRRFPIGRASANVRRDGTVETLQDGILRHLPAPRLRQAGSRLAVCATDPRETPDSAREDACAPSFTVTDLIEP